MAVLELVLDDLLKEYHDMMSVINRRNQTNRFGLLALFFNFSVLAFGLGFSKCRAELHQITLLTLAVRGAQSQPFIHPVNKQSLFSPLQSLSLSLRLQLLTALGFLIHHHWISHSSTLSSMTILSHSSLLLI
ncbi:hypothetical protein CsSME_00027822 [Camellia sinensis var. sinensis]